MIRHLIHRPTSCLHAKRRISERRLRGEPLEKRELLSISPHALYQVQFPSLDGNRTLVDRVDGIVRVIGTDGPDTIIVAPTAQNLVVSINGSRTVVSDDGVQGFVIEARGGRDNVRIDRTFTQSVMMDGGRGNDILQAGTGLAILLGGQGNDILRGGPEPDLLDGGDGHDRLDGGGGDDRLFGSRGNDILRGFAGDDQLLGGGQNDVLYGGPGNDLLAGGPGNDRLFGEHDDDVLDGGGNEDVLHGDRGNDEVTGAAGHDEVHGDLGNDLLWGDRSFFLELDYRPQLQASLDNRSIDTNQDGRLNLLDVHLLSRSVQDIAIGFAGSDRLEGGQGNDVLAGGDGNDRLLGGIHADLAIGGAGLDDVSGNEGDDIVIGGKTDFDDSRDALRAILVAWTSGDSYQARRDALTRDGSFYQLSVDGTVTDEGLSDHISGDLGRDLFFVPYGEPVAPGGGHGHHHAAHEFPGLDVVEDRHSNEAVLSRVPHADNSVLREEHFALFELVPYDRVTHTAARSGSWSDPRTWADGRVPSPGARALIPAGIVVTVDEVLTRRLDTLRVDGTLAFDPNVDTELRVDTLIVSGSGTFQMGTPEAPIRPDATAKLLIADTGPIDRRNDPLALGRGLIVHGKMAVHGAEATPFVPLQVHSRQRQNRLILKEVPRNWRVGDEIVLAGTGGSSQDERLEIFAIDGNVVTVKPLLHDHIPPEADLEVHVAHLTRNAVIESENPALDRRGHFMAMHTREIDIVNAGFYHLGRSDKTQRANDPVVDEDGHLVPGTGTNARGRYAVHFHRNGVGDDGRPSTVRGSVVTDSRGWGYVNHSSFVHFEDNVAFDVDGAAFVTEAGDEIGHFRRNIAIHSAGSGNGIEARKDIQDFGHQGDGFWFQGGGVEVTGNVAAGHRGQGFVFFTEGLVQDGLGRTTFLVDNLPERLRTSSRETLSVEDVPISNFRDNVAYASRIGAATRFHMRSVRHPVQSVIEDLVLWNNNSGLNIPYTHQTVVRNVRILRDPARPSGTGINLNSVTRSIRYQNIEVVGYDRGVVLPQRGWNTVEGGFFDNRVNFHIPTSVEQGRRIEFNGNIRMGEEAQASSFGRRPYDIFLDGRIHPRHESIMHAFYRDQILLDFGDFDRQRLYFEKQRSDAVPFPEAGPFIPDEFVGKTNAELQREFGLAFGGALAPENARIDPAIRGLIGPPAS